MEYATDFHGNRSAYPRVDEARHEFKMIEQLAQHALGDLPPHRDLVEALCARAGAGMRTGTI